MTIVSTVYAYALSASDQHVLVSRASTNLVNLDVRPVTAMVASAFLSVDPVEVWTVLTTLALVLLVLLVRRFGNIRAAMLVAAAAGSRRSA